MDQGLEAEFRGVRGKDHRSIGQLNDSPEVEMDGNSWFWKVVADPSLLVDKDDSPDPDGPPVPKHELLQRIGLALFGVLIVSLIHSFGTPLPSHLEFYFYVIVICVVISTLAHSLTSDFFLELNLKTIPYAFRFLLIGWSLYFIGEFLGIFNISCTPLYFWGGYISGAGSGLYSVMVGPTIGILLSKRYNPFPIDTLYKNRTKPLIRYCIGGGILSTFFPIFLFYHDRVVAEFIASELFVLVELTVMTKFAVTFLREADMQLRFLEEKHNDADSELL